MSAGRVGQAMDHGFGFARDAPEVVRPVNARFSRRSGASLSLPATDSAAPGEDEIMGPAIWGKDKKRRIAIWG
ncbi:hypothetical protein N7510_006696 [Penicillium lagena]|uniref:uncharacterized protein n=1 Tax=Penicillium lagena TaxID=94218 RepID=UPI002541998A|nr:uncharacterized protein N7510_006696 [Penicillium lagena]KAJ5609977.1 hypothetical protein N7510_006696 [Penicillium lagena]